MKKSFSPKKNFVQKRFWSEKRFCSEKNFGRKKNFGQKIYFGLKNILVPKKILVEKKFVQLGPGLKSETKVLDQSRTLNSPYKPPPTTENFLKGSRLRTGPRFGM